MKSDLFIINPFLTEYNKVRLGYKFCLDSNPVESQDEAQHEKKR